ncbi:MAG: transposase [Alphaproteobacteria bacterium]|nr:transposase [Alphaproteobacteria bacterium]
MKSTSMSECLNQEIRRRAHLCIFPNEASSWRLARRRNPRQLAIRNLNGAFSGTQKEMLGQAA